MHVSFDPSAPRRTLPSLPLASLVSAAALCLSLPAQDTTWLHPDGTVHSYRVVKTTGTTWPAASAAAAAAGGYLATVTSATENALVADLVKDTGLWRPDKNGSAYNGPWIGGVQLAGATEPGSGWGWAELEGFAYANWSSGQPDNGGGDSGSGLNANRIHFGGAGSPSVSTWADASEATTLNGYVIEFSGPTVPRTQGLLMRTPESFDGYTLISPMNVTSTYLIDPRGRVVHSWQSKYRPGQSAYLLPNGNLLRCGKLGNTASPGGGDGGIVEEFDWQNNLVWSFTLSSSTQMLHHDICRMPNGNTLMIVWDYKTGAETLAAGRDPRTLPPSPDNGLWPDKIIEVKKTGTTSGSIVWEWSAFDHLVQDHDSTKANYGDPAKHPELIDVNYSPDGANDWMHTNAIDYNPALDQIMISVRSFDEFWILDHSTTTQEAAGHTAGKSKKGGDILYRWGNPMTYRAADVTSRRLFRQHDAHWIPSGLPGAGNVLAFSNGVERPDGTYSTVEEVTLPTRDSNGAYPMTGKVWGPTAPTWTYKASDPKSFFSIYVSGAQRLPNGNTLVCGGWIGNVREVDQKGVTVWEYTNPVTGAGPAIQGSPVPAVQHAMFRAPRYAADYGAFQGRTLVPGEPLEQHSAVLLADGSTAPQHASIGTNVTFSLRAEHLPGNTYLLATSGSEGLIPMDERFVRVGYDAILEASVFGYAPDVFRGYFGTLDSSTGRGVATLAIPNIPVLAGLKLHSALLVVHPLAPTGVGMISNTVTVEVTGAQ